MCPVRSADLVERRIACLNAQSIAALLHRLALNSSRVDRIPDHFASEADRLTLEIDLWEIWVGTQALEAGFQEWLDGEFGGQPAVDESGRPVPGSAEQTGTSRREALRWNYEEIKAELESFLESR